jgi:DNA-binding response OmpR family regulator
MEQAERQGFDERQGSDVLRLGVLEVRPRDGLATVQRRALTLSVREFGLLVAFVRSGAGIVRREDLYREVWGGRLRSGDRSIDVYVHKLRVKLEEAVPGTRWIHTHVGFGYRFEPEPFTPFSHHGHGSATG